MNDRVIRPSELLPGISESDIPRHIFKEFPISTIEGKCMLGAEITHKIAKFGYSTNKFCLVSLAPGECEYCLCFINLLNASFSRCEYYNSNELAAQLSSCQFHMSLRSPTPGLAEFCEGLQLESDRGTSLKVLRNFPQNILRFITQELLGYEETRLSQLAQNLETEELLNAFKENRMTAFALTALHVADRISTKIPKMKVLERPTNDILIDCGLGGAPISSVFSGYAPDVVGDIFEFLEGFPAFNGDFMLSFMQLEQIVQTYLRKNESIALKSDLVREQQLARNATKGNMSAFYEFVFESNGLEYGQSHIYIYYDALFYPLIIRFLHYKQNAVPITALNIPFKEIQELALEIEENGVNALDDCQSFKKEFEKLTRKALYANMAIGVEALKQITVDLSKCFLDFNISRDSAIFKSEALLQSLNSFTTFEMFVKLLARTVIHTAQLFNHHEVTPLDLQTKATIKAYEGHLKQIADFFQYYDAIIYIQEFYRDTKHHAISAPALGFSKFKQSVVTVQAFCRRAKSTKNYRLRKSAISIILRGLTARATFVAMKHMEELARQKIAAATLLETVARGYRDADIASSRRRAVLTIQHGVINLEILRIATLDYQQMRSTYAATLIQRYLRRKRSDERLVSLARCYYEIVQEKRLSASTTLQNIIRDISRRKRIIEKARSIVEENSSRRETAARLVQCHYRNCINRAKLRATLLHAQLRIEDAAINIQLFWREESFFKGVQNAIDDKIEAMRSATWIIQRFYRSQSEEKVLQTRIPQKTTTSAARGKICTGKRTSLKESLLNSCNAILNAQTPFLEQMNLERIYHAIELNSALIQECQTPELICTLFACANQLPLEVRRAPRTNYRKMGCVLLGLLNDLYNPKFDTETQRLYPLGVRKIYEKRRLPFGNEAVYAVIDAGMLVCRDLRVGTCASTFFTLLSKFGGYAKDTRVCAVRAEWKQMCPGLGDRGVRRVHCLLNGVESDLEEDI